MQLLVVFQKADRKVIATFEWQTFITEMNVIKIPDADFILTTDKNIFHRCLKGELYVK